MMPHTDDMNDAVLVGLALEDDARALIEALRAGDETGYIEDFGRDNTSVCIDGTFDLIAVCRIMRRRYLAASTPEPKSA